MNLINGAAKEPREIYCPFFLVLRIFASIVVNIVYAKRNDKVVDSIDSIMTLFSPSLVQNTTRSSESAPKSSATLNISLTDIKSRFLLHYSDIIFQIIL